MDVWLFAPLPPSRALIHLEEDRYRRLEGESSDETSTLLADGPKEQAAL